MNRLTGHHYNGDGAYMVCSGTCYSDAEVCGACPELEKIVDRLAAYEDTGLEPEEVRSIKTAYDECQIPYEVVATGADAARVIKFVEADDDGRLLVLPIKFGQSFYQVVKTDRRHSARPCEKPVFHVRYGELTWNNLRHVLLDFGKTVFSTKEEAVEAMERMRKEAEG